jgi:hypothetical protein
MTRKLIEKIKKKIMGCNEEKVIATQSNIF